MRVQKLMNDRILKSTETTRASKNDDVAIFVRESLVEMLLIVISCCLSEYAPRGNY